MAKDDKKIEEICSKIIEDMFGLLPLKTLFLKYGITPHSFFKCLERSPSHQYIYECAQRARTELMVEEIVDIADNERDPNRARVMVDARKWYASKMTPKKYGDRIDLNVTQTLDINAALTEAISRSKPDLQLDASKDYKVITQGDSKDDATHKADAVDAVDPVDPADKAGKAVSASSDPEIGDAIDFTSDPTDIFK